MENNAVGTCKYAVVTEVGDNNGNSVEKSASSATLPNVAFQHLSGEEMGFAEVNRVLRRALTRVVIIAGQPSSGKTTLLTSIYEAFSKGPYAGYLFAGSDTMPAYEQRCFPSRLASERVVAETDRTLIGDPKFLHLRVRDQSLRKKSQEIVFSDIAGEVFANGQVSSTEIKALAFLRRADHIAILVDGAKLADPKQRHREANDGRTLLRSLVDNGIASVRQHVHILFSRWDLVLTSGHHDAVQHLLADFQSELTDKFSSKLGKLDFSEIAARPETDILGPRYNVDSLFKSWADTSALYQPGWSLPQSESSDLTRWLSESEG